MVIRSVAQSVPQSVSQSIASGNIIAPLVAGSLVHFDETSIVGATPITAWNNIGIGGSGFDLDVPFGTVANLTKTTINGLDAVSSDGTAGIETTSGTVISNPTTEFMVAKITVLQASDQFTDALATTVRHIFFQVGTTWGMDQGSAITFGVLDTNLHTWTGQFNGDATSKLTVSGEGSVIGDAGSADFNFATFFAANNQGLVTNGIICEYLLYDSALNASQIAQNQVFLTSKWGI